ncbi:MAG: helix-turn-helix domain-containing protein [Thermoplasmatota archaeon]
MHDQCTVYRTIDLIAKKWSMVIILEMYRDGGGPKRYSRIKSGLSDITPKVLSNRLKELEAEGLITKRVDASRVPIKVEYELTESGLDLVDVIKGFKGWALKWKVESTVCEKLDCKECSL